MLISPWLDFKLLVGASDLSLVSHAHIARLFPSSVYFTALLPTAKLLARPLGVARQGSGQAGARKLGRRSDQRRRPRGRSKHAFLM